MRGVEKSAGRIGNGDWSRKRMLHISTWLGVRALGIGDVEIIRVLHVRNKRKERYVS